MDHSDFNYNLSTQEHQKIIPKNYLQRQLIPSGNLKDDGLPAPVQNSSLLPQDALLCVYPPNATRQSYFQGAERAYLHSSPEFKRDLSYLKQRWVFFQAANRGHVPTLVVRSKKGSKTVKITNWVEFVLYNSKKVDDLPTGIPENTGTSTTTSVNNFNFFGEHVVLDPEVQKQFRSLKLSFENEDLGIMCLCSMTHPERALSMAHYADKQTKLSSPDPCSGSSKYNYLHGIQRFLKCYEKFYDVKDLYDTDNWSWKSSHQYSIVRDTLLATTIVQQSRVPAEQRDHASYHLSEAEFGKLNAFTYLRAQSFRDTNFAQYLAVMQHWWVQIFLVFCCPRGGEESVYLRKGDFTVYPPDRLVYEPLMTLKNTTVDSHYNLVTKKPMEIISKEAVELFYIFTHKCHQDFPDSDRLFHRPSGKATPSSRFYFEHKVQGEHFILKAVSFYAKKLQEFDADFPDHPKITNGSVRKCHSYILNTSNLPASVQQRSLGHHSSSSNQYWANNYLDPKDKNIRQQVAQTVAGRISNVFPTNSKPLTFPGTPPQVEPRTPSGTKRPLTQSPNHSIPYRSGTIKLDPINSSDEDFSMDLPRGARVVISLPGGIQMKFKITK